MAVPQSRIGRRRPATAALALAVLVLAVTTAVGPAAAEWTASGSGSGMATVGTLPAPASVTATSSTFSAVVSWSAVTPPESTLSGYYVTRWSGGTSAPACGTSADGPYLTALTCTDSGMAAGTYSYRVTAVWRSWTATSSDSNLVSISSDPALPSQSVAVVPGATGAALVGPTLYFRSDVAGVFRFDTTVTDLDSGPASVTYPGVGASGWTHAAETVTVANAGGTATVKTYRSSPLSWTPGASAPSSYTVTGRDTVGNTVTTTFAFTSDNSAPTGGALTVNAVAATAGGSTSLSGVNYAVTRTDYSADGGSGLASSVLTREFAPASGTACGTFGAPVTLTGAPLQTGLTTGCYRYTLTGTDRVGNTSTVTTTVLYDVALPTATVGVTSAAASVTGSTVYFRDSVAGTLRLDVAVTDQASGPASTAFPRLNRQGWTFAAQTVTSGTGGPATVTYSSNAFAWDVGANRINNYNVTATDRAGNQATVAVRLQPDSTAPTGGSLTVNGVGATPGGSSSANGTGSFTIARTDYTDAASGIASSVLTREFASLTGGSCGAFGAPTDLTGGPAQSGLPSGCYRYTLTGTDRVGNTSAISTVVQLSPYVSSVVMLNGSGTAGRMDAGDRIVISFSDDLAVSSVCAAWSGDGVDQQLTGDGQVTVTLANSNPDQVTLSSSACQLNVGTLILGSNGYTGADVSFGGAGAAKNTVTWTSGTRVLTVVLGAPSGATSTVASSAPVFTPSAVLRSTGGTPFGGSYTAPLARQF